MTRIAACLGTLLGYLPGAVLVAVDPGEAP